MAMPFLLIISFKIGDRLIIEDGKTMQLLAPQTQPLQPHKVFPK